MGWDKKRYYTRSKKVNGRVVREYVGSGEFAKLAAEVDALEREGREMARAKERASREEFDCLDSLIEDFCDQSDQLIHAALKAVGFHQHKGQWRKRRARQTKAS